MVVGFADGKVEVGSSVRAAVALSVGAVVGVAVTGDKVGAVVGLRVSSGQSFQGKHQASAREIESAARRRAATFDEGKCILGTIGTCEVAVGSTNFGSRSSVSVLTFDGGFATI
jgi:hypothetical protein